MNAETEADKISPGEKVTFIEHQRPSLRGGGYELTVSQTLADSDGALITGKDELTNTYRIAVMAERFSLKQPGVTVNSVFPPMNAAGEFSTVLPHVVFANPTFPWSRQMNGSAAWLAVLLLDEDDAKDFPGLSFAPESMTLGDLRKSSGGNDYSHFATPNDKLEPGEQEDDPVQVLEVPGPLFSLIAPSLEDLKYTAHVREVTLDNKPTGQGPDPGKRLGAFSIVFGTRLPQCEKKSYAYLVSLDNLKGYLPPAQVGADKTVRLAVLKSWAFYSLAGQPAKFVEGLLGLNGRDLTKRDPAGNTNLRLEYKGQSDDTPVGRALRMGYVPLNETLRTGEPTVSWYRGPLVPYPISRRGVGLPIASPDAAMIFDPTTGMLDVSYAAAWVLGRMLALQDKAFSTGLYNWKGGLSHDVIDAVEDQLLGQTLGGALGQPAETGMPWGVAPPVPFAKSLLRLVLQQATELLPKE